jgi:hypothetical protein
MMLSTKSQLGHDVDQSNQRPGRTHMDEDACAILEGKLERQVFD